jgi:hypothetical protein
MLGILEVYEKLIYCPIVLPFLSPVSEEWKHSDE